jgi:membrane-associated phospholipid phosphatase
VHDRTPSLLPTRFHLPALLIALVGWAEMVALGIHFAGQHTPDPFDASVASTAYEFIGERSALARVLVSPSDSVTVYLVIAAVLGYGLFVRRWDVLLLGAVGPGLAIGLVELVGKPLFGRTFPRGGLSYPSGHTVSSVAALTVALLVVLGLLHRPRQRLLAGLIWLLLVLTLMVGLVAMRYHYLTDTFGGVGLALGVVLPCAVLVSRWTDRHSKGPATDQAETTVRPTTRAARHRPWTARPAGK